MPFLLFRSAVRLWFVAILSSSGRPLGNLKGVCVCHSDGFESIRWLRVRRHLGVLLSTSVPQFYRIHLFVDALCLPELCSSNEHAESCRGLVHCQHYRLKQSTWHNTKTFDCWKRIDRLDMETIDQALTLSHGASDECRSATEAL